MDQLSKRIIRSCHLIGVGGIGMSALAKLLIQKGVRVTGSDSRLSALTEELSHLGAVIYLDHRQENIKGADIVIYSSAIKPDNPEYKAAVDANISLVHRAEMLAFVLQDKKGIAVAGAHGKTTTTSMIAHVLLVNGLDPTTAVGGIVQNSQAHAHVGKGDYFVIEADESDQSFLKFYPSMAVITNVDKEHIDFYGSWENIQDAYRKFIDQVDDHGALIVCGQDKTLMDLVAQSSRQNVIRYGFEQDNNIVANDVMCRSTGSIFTCLRDGQEIGKFELAISGKHNILNALAAITVCLEVGLSAELIIRALKSFQGVKRRFQLLGDVQGIKFIDDYAHHPTELTATLETANLLHCSNLLVIFQPHRYTRLQSLFSEFVESLSLVKDLIITDVYAASEAPIDGIDAQTLVRAILKARPGQNVEYIAYDNLAGYIAHCIQEGDVVLTLGAGDINQVGPQIMKQIAQSRKKLEVS